MASQTVTKIEAILTKAKAGAGIAITDIEGVLAKAKTEAGVVANYLKHLPLVRIAIAVLAIVVVAILHKLGWDSAVVAVAYSYGMVLLIGTILIELMIVWGNTKIECSRIQYLQKDDGAPGPLGGGVQQALEAAGTTLVDKSAPKTIP